MLDFSDLPQHEVNNPEDHSAPSVDLPDPFADLLDGISSLFIGFWQALRDLVYYLGDAVLVGFEILFELIAILFFALLNLLIAFLPNMVDIKVPNGYSSGLMSLNQILPITEIFTIMNAWGAVLAARGVYMLARFIRGGG